MGAVLSVQLSAFSNKKIVPSAETIAVIMPKLKEISSIDFLPSVINTQKLDISTGNIESVPNLSFSSLDNKNKIVCTENRIDCTFNYDIEEQANVNNGFTFSVQILKFIMEYGSVFANRLALNINFISNICDGTSEFENQVMHIVPFYQDKKIKEWSSRTNALGTIIIADHEEELNIITEYNHATKSTGNEKRIVCHSDINTVAENKDYRFTYSDIESFMKQVKEIFMNIQSDLEDMVK